MEEAIRAAATALQSPLQFMGRYSEGEFGAFRVADASGRHYALKIGRDYRIGNGAATTALLSAQGYPAPRYLESALLSSGRSWALLEELSGVHPSQLNLELVSQLIALVDSQTRKAILPPGPSALDLLLSGGEPGYYSHAAMRSHSTTTSELLDELIAIGRRHANLDFPTTDIVHFDFHPGNILILDGKVSGVVDWDGTCSGDRAFDLATLLFYTSDQAEVRPLLWQALLERAGPSRAAVYLAHMILRQVAWSAEYHTPAAVEGFSNVSRTILEDVRSL